MSCSAHYPYYLSSGTTPFSQTKSSHLLLLHPRPFSPLFFNYRPRLSRHKRATFFASSVKQPGGSDGFSWLHLSQSIRRGSDRFFKNLGDSVKRETGLDFERANAGLAELAGRARQSAQRGQSELERFRSELIPVFFDWNKWERWKVKFLSFSLSLSDFMFRNWK